MRRTYLHLSPSEFKDKFSDSLQHNKKIRALENFSYTRLFCHGNFLKLIKECLSTDFLESKEREFLDYLLMKYELDYLTWCHKTKWLRGEIKKRANTVEESLPARTPEQFEFLFAKNTQENAYRIPLEVLIAQQQQSGGLRL